MCFFLSFWDIFGYITGFNIPWNIVKFIRNGIYSRMAAKGNNVDSFGWNTVAGRQRPRFVAGKGTRNSSKRQRVSTSSAGSSVGASRADVSFDENFSIEHFKTLNTDEKLESIFVCLHDIKLTNQRLLKAEQTVHEIHESTLANKARIDILAYKSIDSEARQRRNNLIFWGIPEVLNEDCMLVLSEFLRDKLELDPDTIVIQRAHRIGRRSVPRRNVIGRAVNTPKHRPLIAALRDYQDVELILSNTGKLRGTRFGVNRDYPQEIINARKPLLDEKRQLRSKYPNSNISIQYPAKLIKDGQIVKDMFPEWREIMRLSRLESTNRVRVENSGTREPTLVESVFNGNISESSVMEHSDHSDGETESVKLQHDIDSILGTSRKEEHVQRNRESLPARIVSHPNTIDGDCSNAGEAGANATTGRPPPDSANDDTNSA